MDNIQPAIQKSLWVVRETDIPRRLGVKLKHPKRPTTDNLKYNATQVEQIDVNTQKVFINEDIAPYMPYTNEPWVSEKWKGAKNPNENWFSEFFDKFARQLASELGGELIIKG